MVAVTVRTTRVAHAPNLSLGHFAYVMLHMFPDAQRAKQKSVFSKLLLPIAAKSVLLGNLDLMPNLELHFEP